MHLAHLRLRDFRNYARLDVDFAPGFHLLLGDNAQGKTNVLEAIYLVATLRSFRGVGSAQMVRHGQKGYFVGSKIIGQGEHETKMYWSAAEKNLAFRKKFLGKTLDVITLQAGDQESTEALSDNYLKVKVDGWHEPNQLMKVAVTEIDNEGLVAVAQQEGTTVPF